MLAHNTSYGQVSAALAPWGGLQDRNNAADIIRGINSRQYTADCPPHSTTPTLRGFSLYPADRAEASRKVKGGGVCFHVNQRRCTDSTLISKACSTVSQTHTIKCRPFYLPGDRFTVLKRLYSANSPATDTVLILYWHSPETILTQP